ncbi:NAD(P)-binding protein [Streptomyces sp. NPDC057199]
MARIVVLGAALGGLQTALLLAQDGHQVTVLERDPQPPPSDAEPA